MEEESTVLERLEGRLMWERTSQGILVTIPIPRGLTVPLYGPLVIIWLVFASFHYWHLLAAPHPDITEFNLQLIALGVYAVGTCFFLCWMIWIFTAENVLSLVPSEMKIQRRVIGIEVAVTRFPTHNVRNLRYIPPTKFWALSGYIDPKTSYIQFRAGSTKHSFARGVTETEAHALIRWMLEVYNFPNRQLPGEVDDPA
jgi:hypothetical protein